MWSFGEEQGNGGRRSCNSRNMMGQGTACVAVGGELLKSLGAAGYPQLSAQRKGDVGRLVSRVTEKGWK